jgi:hypothetical protein
MEPFAAKPDALLDCFLMAADHLAFLDVPLQ